MEIRTRTEADQAIIELQGSFDAHSAEAFNRFQHAWQVSEGQRVIIDFGKVDLITSHALHGLLLLHKKVRAAKGDVAFCRVGPDVRQVMRMSGISNLIRVYTNLRDALSAEA